MSTTSTSIPGSTGPTDQSYDYGLGYSVQSIADSEDKTFLELADEFCKENSPPKTKQDWKKKNKRRLPKWAK